MRSNHLVQSDGASLDALPVGQAQVHVGRSVRLVVSGRGNRARIRGSKHRMWQIGYESSGLIAHDGTARIRTEGRSLHVKRGVQEAENSGASVTLNGSRVD